MATTPTALTWADFQAERQRRGIPFIVAHRGASALEPENTLAAFARALADGADAIETDLRFSADDEIVLHHDETLERTTAGHGYVRDLPLRELKRIPIRGLGGQGFTAERIPTLIELLELTQARVPLLLELKDPLFRDRAYARRLVRILEAYDMLERTAIASFHLEHVRTVHAICPDIPVGYITLHNPFPVKAPLLGPFWPLLLLNPLYVKWAHAMGKIVCPLDPNPEPRVRWYLRLHVDALLANHPRRVREALHQGLRAR
nr:glycerophosphodiester phosphodiesterase [Ardenticatena sp.]